MQKLQNITAGYTLNRYAGYEETIKQKWLPVQERLDLAVAKLAHKSLYDENFPADLKNEFQEQRRPLRNTTEKQSLMKRLHIPNTFNEISSIVFNELPVNLRSNENHKKYITLCKKYYFDRAFAKLTNT